jgi:FAD/FMN-containing dehydrogenase/Fe-S oxidoreductase
MTSRLEEAGLTVDAAALAAELRGKVSGDVRFDDGTRALYATDGSNYRQVPIGVVLPKTKQDILETVALCRKYGAPLLSRGAGTSLAGQCCNVAVVLDMSKYYNRILAIDAEGRTARIQPGVVLDRLRDEAAKVGLTFGPDPATHTHCTLGGMMGNNSCGVHALMAGKTVDNVLSLEILTYDGFQMEVGSFREDELSSILQAGGRKAELFGALRAIRDQYADLVRARFPKIPRRVSGYNLDCLLPEAGFDVAKSLIGSEGTLVVILEATVRLVHNPPAKTLVLAAYPSAYECADHVPEVLRFKPIGLEGIDHELVHAMRTKKPHSKPDLMPEGKGWLYVEFGGDSKAASDEKARAFMQAMAATPNPPAMKLYTDRAEEAEVWEIRESALGATAFVPDRKDRWEGWEDSAVDPAHLGAYLRELRKLCDDFGYESTFYGHFGEGCIHTRTSFDLVTEEGIQRMRRFVDAAADLCIRYGGSISGEHGDGQSRGELLPKMFGPELIEAFGAFKAAWDPQNKMNPGKLVHPNRIVDNLRLGTTYAPHKPETYFHFPNDRGDFSRAALRCVGVGKCRRDTGGTMCPSYRATREEKHSTRGRAHLLFEMLRGEVVQDGWKNQDVKDALDLCLACKGCKNDCPVKVDVATYKAEFLAHYYEGRLRPRHAYAFGWIYWWARLASKGPRLANFFTQTPGLSRLAKGFADAAPERKIPKFALQTFRNWFERRTAPPPQAGEGGGAAPPGRGQVLLWPDTFNNYFHPETARAATELLEGLGWEVVLPPRVLCCGRPLYDYGFLNMAERLLRQILDTLRPWIQAGVPLVGLEPSCLAVFRDELVNLVPDDPDAKRLQAQSFTLTEFLTQTGALAELPPLTGRAVVQGHCHHKAVMGFQPDIDLLKRIGLTLSNEASGCCGMAGAFGFESEHYGVAMQCGELETLPAVRQAAPEDFVIADGFSCREQIAQATGRRPLHLAEVLLKALKEKRE